VIGRLANAQREGIFADAGLLGHRMPPPDGVRRAKWQYILYERDLPAPEFKPYFSHPGGQGFLLSLVDAVTDFSNTFNFSLLQAIVALFTAIVLAFFMNWLRIELGWKTASLVLAVSLAAQWLTVFGRNLYWFTGIFFLPMLVMCFGLQRKRDVTVGWIAFNSAWPMLLKCLITGFELITTTTVMMTTAIVYYAVKYKWSVQRALSNIAIAVVGAGIAVLLTLVVLTAQIAIVKGGPEQGIDHIVRVFGKRTHGDPAAFTKQELKDSLQVDLTEVLQTYLLQRAFSARGVVDAFGLRDDPRAARVRRLGVAYWQLILLFAGCTVVLLWLCRTGSAAPGQQPVDREATRAVALCAATWWSVLAPLSWFILFKGHSYIHPHIDTIAWHMPFTFFGLALVGFCVTVIAERSRAKGA
jgi:hypothetical protein